MMMLRSSSTPVLGSLIPSFSESPNNINHHHHHHQHSDQFHGAQTPPIRRKLSCCSSKYGGGSQISGKSLFQGTTTDNNVVGGGCSSIRRAQSEGNLKGLAGDAPSAHDVDELSFSKKTRRSSKPALETIPSFSLHGGGVQSDGEDAESQDEEEEGFHQVGNLFTEKVRRDVNYRNDNSRYVVEQGKMYIAAGLGISGADLIDGGGLGGGAAGGRRPVDFGDSGGGGGLRLMEQHYKKMVEEHQGNPLVLRNYAQFLYQKKGDTEGAEEYYSRAILADPQDGEVLSQYAQMIWEIHRDKERARSYFERAVRASSNDSHIHAAYASFLWDVDGEEEEGSEDKLTVDEPLLHRCSFVASAKI